MKFTTPIATLFKQVPTGKDILFKGYTLGAHESVVIATKLSNSTKSKSGSNTRLKSQLGTVTMHALGQNIVEDRGQKIRTFL